MARRGAKPSVPLPPRPSQQSDTKNKAARPSTDRDQTDLEQEAAETSERVRRIALGLTAALVTARAFWPSEPDLREGAGGGLYWLFVVFIAFGLALTSALVGGRLRFRWSWTDALVVGLMGLVAISAFHSLDRRPAINLAWEWVGLGLVYLLVRNLPRTQDESSTLAGVIVATAFAVSAYGLYQLVVELPLIRAEYLRNPLPILQKLGIEPGGERGIVQEPRAGVDRGLLDIWPGQFAGGFSRRSARDRPCRCFPEPGPPRRVEATMGGAGHIGPGHPGASRLPDADQEPSAWLGLLVALIFLGWRARREVSIRVLAAAVGAGLTVVAALVAVGLKARLLDREVLTQSAMSLRYRWEYWQGAWGVISGGATSLWQAVSSPFFWWGVGPGNFASPYLKYKLPQSSEEILDPHSLFLEVWATAGFWALLALAGALGLGLWNLLGQGIGKQENVDASRTARASRRQARRAGLAGKPARQSGEDGLDAPPRHVGWLVACAGAGGWALVVVLGRLNPFEGDLFFRWMILGVSWAAALLVRHLAEAAVPATAVAAGVVATLVNLLAAGGIGVPTVALGLWAMLAIGLNLRDDRRCGWLREYESRIPAFAMATGWAALLGTFVGLVAPFWRAESFIAEAEAAIAHRPPNFDGADDAYVKAGELDPYYARPWRKNAALHMMVWQQNVAAPTKPTRAGIGKQSRFSTNAPPSLRAIPMTGACTASEPGRFT